MRRQTLTRTLAAVAMGALPLWPSASHAASELNGVYSYEPPGTGTTCTIELSAYVFSGGAVFGANVLPYDEPNCDVRSLTLFGYATAADGDVVSGLSNSSGPGRGIDLQLYQGVDITRTSVEISFVRDRSCCRSFDLPQPK